MGYRLKVAFDARSLTSVALRGWDRYTVGLVRALGARGLDVTLFHLMGQPPREEHVADLGCELLPITGRDGMFWEQVAVPQALAAGNFALFHGPAERSAPLFARCPTVLTFHSATVPSYASLIDRGLLGGDLSDYVGAGPMAVSPRAHYVMAQLRWADHLATPSEFCRDEIIRFLGVPADRVTTTLLGLPDQFTGPRNPARTAATLSRLSIRRPYVLYVGGYEAHKNVSTLLATFRNLKNARPGLAMVLVGTGPVPAELLSKAREIGSVTCLSDLGDELTDLYDGAKLFISMSWRETFCLPALEALARGCPVITSEWGVAGEIVGRHGLLVDPRRDDLAAAAALTLLERDNTTAAAESRKHALQFSWGKTAEKTIAMYDQLLQRSPRRRDRLVRQFTERST